MCDMKVLRFSQPLTVPATVFSSRRERTRGPRGRPQAVSRTSPPSLVLVCVKDGGRRRVGPQQVNLTARKSEAVFTESDPVKNEEGKAEGGPSSSLFCPVWKNHFLFTRTVVPCESFGRIADRMCFFSLSLW